MFSLHTENHLFVWHQMSAIDAVYEGSYVHLKQSEGVAGE